MSYSDQDRRVARRALQESVLIQEDAQKLGAAEIAGLIVMGLVALGFTLDWLDRVTGFRGRRQQRSDDEVDRSIEALQGDIEVMLRSVVTSFDMTAPDHSEWHEGYMPETGSISTFYTKFHSPEIRLVEEFERLLVERGVPGKVAGRVMASSRVRRKLEAIVDGIMPKMMNFDSISDAPKRFQAVLKVAREENEKWAYMNYSRAGSGYEFLIEEYGLSGVMPGRFSRKLFKDESVFKRTYSIYRIGRSVEEFNYVASAHVDLISPVDPDRI